MGYFLTQQPAKTTEKQRYNNMGVIYGLGEASETASGHLFWDDGDSIDTIHTGEYILLKFTGTQVLMISFCA